MLFAMSGEPETETKAAADVSAEESAEPVLTEEERQEYLSIIIKESEHI